MSSTTDLRTTGYRADHVGSLLRPPEVLAAAAAHADRRIGDERLRDIQNRAILKALEMQREVGIDVLSDGEFRRGWFAGAWSQAIEGFVNVPGGATQYLAWHGSAPELATASLNEAGVTVAIGKPVRQVRRFAADECAFLREHAAGPFKVTLPGVVSQALRWYVPGISDSVYASRREMVDELAAILGGEVGQLVTEGASYIQLDSLVYVIQLCDPSYREAVAGSGIDLEELLDEAIAADNASLAPARAAGVTTGLHMCRGNNRSQWTAAGGYEAVAEKAFNLLEVDRLLLEYDSDRAGGFEPLRFVPEDKTIVLGLISTKTPELESADELLRRIEEASHYVPLERLALSPQCGFASVAKGNLLSADDQRRKLELVVETARRVWG
jgi:5-methyltetrahydropteroyltriglutamate--homocysteine methyltransferase